MSGMYAERSANKKTILAAPRLATGERRNAEQTPGDAPRGPSLSPEEQRDRQHNRKRRSHGQPRAVVNDAIEIVNEDGRPARSKGAAEKRRCA